MFRFAAATARRSAAASRTAQNRCLASAKKHAAKPAKPPRAPERDLSSRQLFAALGLRTFSREELRQRFDAADADADGYLTRHEAAELFGGALDVEADRKAAARAVLRRLDKDQDNRVSWDEFRSTILEEASRRDKRIWPLAGTMFLGGLSVGAVMPIMPILVSELGLGPADYGVVISAFGFLRRVGIKLQAPHAIDGII